MANNMKTLLNLTDTLAAVLKTIPELYSQVEQSRAKIKEFITEGRDPTPKEWEELNYDIELLRKEIISE